MLPVLVPFMCTYACLRACVHKLRAWIYVCFRLVFTVYSSHWKNAINIVIRTECSP